MNEESGKKHKFIYCKNFVLDALTLKGKISKLAILAMSEIGRGKLTGKDIDKIIKALKKEDIDNLKHHLLLAPQWIAETITKALENE